MKETPFRLCFKFVRIFLVGIACVSSLAVIADGEVNEGEFGNVSFPVSCDAGIQPAINRAVAQLHNMMYVEAEKMFGELAKENPDCAMLYWGIAMSNFHPLWPGVSSKPEMERGKTAIDRAVELGGANERENAYINAAAEFFSDSASSDPERIAAWAKAQKSVYDQNPDDVDATAFFALSHLAVAPKADKSLTNQKEAGQLIEQLHAQSPQHPAGFHYLIHAYDNPLLASKAESVSRAYDKIAPTVPHALHMPSHIFVRMGLWDETVFWNDRSAQAALEVSPENFTLSHFAHALDYKVYAHLQRGETQQAAATLEEMNRIANHQNDFGAAYGLAAASVRVSLESENWEASSKTAVRVQQSIDWDKFPATEAIVYFARGIGAARAGDVDAATMAEARLRELHEQLHEEGPAYWETLVESQLNSVSAWIAYARSDLIQAEKLMLTAADLEDSLDKSPVTPSAVLPARELLGDLLGLLGKHEAALSAYETALTVSPNRARSLRGVVREANATGDTGKADRYTLAIADLTAPAVTLKNYVVSVGADAGMSIKNSQLAASEAASEKSLERVYGVSLLEEFRSDDLWFLTFSADNQPDLDAYLAALEVVPNSVLESFFVNSPALAGGPKAGATPRAGHKVFMIERDLPGVGLLPREELVKISRGSQAIVEKLGDGVEWDHSYLTAEGTYCVYRTSDPALIQEHAHLAGIPADPVTQVEQEIHDLNFAHVTK